ncbi:MAG: zf-HC2 domain-containing protein [Candidatus Aminicenantes bacterium]|jgi:hypothetical protein
MNDDCKRINRDLVAFLYGELDPQERERVKSHLNSCPRCQGELEGIKELTRTADSLKGDMEETMASVDWDALPNTISDAVFDRRSVLLPRARRRNFWETLFFPRFKPLYATLLAGLILGSLATLIIVRTSLSKRSPGESFFVTQEFLERVELEMARRDTLDYLEKSQYVLLDFVQASPERTRQAWRRDLVSQVTEELLAKKRYINPQLDKFRMAKAKEICDQIEFLFFELTQISDQLSEEDLQKIQNLIDENQLLLKIKLLKKDLEESEV